MFPLLGKNKTDKLLYSDTWIAPFNPGMKEEAQIYFSNCAIFYVLERQPFSGTNLSANSTRQAVQTP